MRTSRRRWFSFVPVGFWGWRVHELAKHTCASGGTLALLLKGEPWKLTERERQLTEWIAREMNALDPAEMQRKMPKL